MTMKIMQWVDLEQYINDNIQYRLCWGAGRAHGSLISFQIGTPVLDIFETKESDDGPSKRVHVVGDFSVYIMYCEWKIFNSKNKIIVTSEDEISLINKNIRKIDGLNFVSIKKIGDDIFLYFDFGAYICVSPSGSYEEEDELISIIHRSQKLSIEVLNDKICMKS